MSELEKIITNFDGTSVENLYNQLIFLNDVDTNFNGYEEKKFIVTLFYLISNKELSFSEYSKCVRNINEVKAQTYDNFKASLKTKFPEWISYSTVNAKKQDNIMKLYLSIDNSFVHFFMNSFLYECLVNKIDDFDFKINNQQGINSRENIVINCNENNIVKYIELINKILDESPEIKFNSPHLLGVPYNDEIYCGIDVNEGKTSYTMGIAIHLFMGLQNGQTVDYLTETIENFRFFRSFSIKELTEKRKK